MLTGAYDLDESTGSRDGDGDDDIFKFTRFFNRLSSTFSVAELTLVSELTLDERPLLCIDFCGDNCRGGVLIVASWCLRARSDGPTFNADLRKSLFCHLVVGSAFAMPLIDDEDDVRTVLVGESAFGASGGNVLLLHNRCFDGDMDGVRCDVSDELLELDLSLDVCLSMDFDLVRVDELLRDTDGDFDDELSRNLIGDSLYLMVAARSAGRLVTLSLELFSFLKFDEYESMHDASL